MSRIETDYLVIGSGIAGLSLGIKLSTLGTVAMVSKREFLAGSTTYAQGGIADRGAGARRFVRTAMSKTRCAPATGCARKTVVRGVVEEGPERIKELINWGMAFTQVRTIEDESHELGLEGGHPAAAVLHAGDATGAEIAQHAL